MSGAPRAIAVLGALLMAGLLALRPAVAQQVAAQPAAVRAADAAGAGDGTPPADTDQRYRALIAEASALRNQGRLDDSLQRIAQAEAIDEAEGAVSMPTQFHKGLTLAALERHREAIAAFDRGIAVQRDYPLAWWYRALSNEALDQRQQARADLEHFGALVGPWSRKRGKFDAQRREEFRDKLAQYGLARKYRF